MTGSTNTGGAGLNLRIVGTNTQPPRPTENMIWINTSTRIPDWYWQSEEPTEKETGTLWIGVNGIATNKLDLLRNNSIVIGVGTTKQWNGTAWESVGGKVYYDGEWHSLQTFVYDGSKNAGTGNYNEDVGGKPWTTGTDGGSGSATDSTDHFSFRANGSAGVAWYMTAKQIDFTEVKSVSITFTASKGGARNYGFLVSTTKGSWDVQHPIASSGEYSASYTTKQTATIDTTSLTGNYWLGLSIYGTSGDTTVNVFSIELIS